MRIDLISADANWVDTRVKICPMNGWTLITLRDPGGLQAFNETVSEALQAVT